MNIGEKLSRSVDISERITRVLQQRLQVATERFQSRTNAAYSAIGSGAAAWMAWPQYAVDCAQRALIFWDTLRQRGNNFIEHTQKGLPPVLSFEYDMIADGRRFERAVNYALVAIKPPQGVSVDAKRRPYVIIDPRAGHGPGIGGFKDDSQVGVALAAGHPVYFVIFFRDPEPGQTLLDVCAAEEKFVRMVRERHPQSPKPAIVGNCQGGWAAMMLAAADPDDTGPIVINGAPMSYWGGAWNEGAGDNPMRYAGGMLGGTWLASLTSDLGDGVFNPDEIDVSRELRSVIALRDDVLDEVTQLYFERRRTLAQLAQPASEAEAAALRLRSAELAAGIDAWTGGWFSRALRSPATPRIGGSR